MLLYLTDYRDLTFLIHQGDNVTTVTDLGDPTSLTRQWDITSLTHERKPTSITHHGDHTCTFLVHLVHDTFHHRHPDIDLNTRTNKVAYNLTWNGKILPSQAVKKENFHHFVVAK